MTALRFTLRAEPDQRLDLSPLTPDRLAGLALADIAAIALHTTRHTVTVGDLFRIAPSDPESIVIEGGSHRFDRVGEAMTDGTLRVEGDVGQRAGRLMAGGTLTIAGSSGGWAGSGLRGGLLEISGDAGDFLGGPLAGERTGMRGGMVLVHGSAGRRAADRLRRGIVIVEGDAGDHAGSAMIAGTLVVCGTAGVLPGILMRRGTIVLGHAAEIAPTFLATTGAQSVFTALLARALLPTSVAAANRIRATTMRYIGDTAVPGEGEMLIGR